MAVLEICFLSGRYHATAWGRNVNEGEPEWPPSPHRLARALLDMWYRRHPDHDAQTVQEALLLLAGQPRMALPPTASMVVKHYLDQNSPEGSNKQPVLDACICMEKGARAFIELPEGASDAALETLGILAEALPYLGRSESWVALAVRSHLPEDRTWNCCPSPTGALTNCLLAEEGYAALPTRPTTGGKKKTRECTWLEALALSTAALQESGWNRHPLLAKGRYDLPDIQESHRNRRLLPVSKPLNTLQSAPPTDAKGFIVTYALYSKPLPPITEAVTFAERIRCGLMSRHRQICGGDASTVSPIFSGKDTASAPLKGHQHAFYWPCDLDGDGKIDHVRIFSPRSVDAEEMQAFESLKKLWVGRDDLGKLVFLHVLPMSHFPLATEVVSRTPVVFGRHYKPGKGSYAAWLDAEVLRSCVAMNLPAPIAVRPEPALPVRDEQSIAWRSFRRQRKNQRAQPGFGFRLTFAKAVPVPFAIGSLAHFGLGLFEGV